MAAMGLFLRTDYQQQPKVLLLPLWEKSLPRTRYGVPVATQSSPSPLVGEGARRADEG
jgi:hypothetical protein